MQADLVFSPREMDGNDLVGKIAVVIDVFRFTTTTLTALENGAKAVLPAATPQQAVQLASSGDVKRLLAGERDAKPLKGFSFGNSPLEARKEVVGGCEIVSTTTNGTQAILACSEAKQIVIASLRNAEAIAGYLMSQNTDLIIVPAGLYGRFSMEDVWCGGYILSKLTCEYKDGAKAAICLTENTPINELTQSAHGQTLSNLGLQEDINFCLTCDVSDLVLVVDNGRIVARTA